MQPMMPEQDKHIHELLNRFFQGTISPEEKELLANWIDEFGDDAMFEQFMKQAWQGFVPDHTLNDAKAGEILQSIIQKGNAKSALPGKSDRQTNRILPLLKTAWFQYAALLVLVFCMAAYVWFQQPPAHETALKPTSKPAKTNKIAGSNRAMLTLADGSSIILDSAANGTLKVEGNIKIVKLNTGQLAYQQEAGKSTYSTISYNTISTPRGGQYQLTLPEGSKIWLNAASSLRFPASFTGNDRRVELKGEAYFEVAKDPHHPFYVKTNGMEVRVLGTTFNINAYEEEDAIKTTLVTGSVRVSSGNDFVMLKPGQQSLISDDGNRNESILINQSATTVTDALAWKEGWFNFEDTELATAMRQLERWYDVNVEIEGNVSKARLMARISKDLPLEKVLHKLELTGKIHVRTEGKKIWISR